MADERAWNKLRGKLFFRLRERWNTLVLRPLRVAWWAAQGMTIGQGTGFSKLHVTWPHQVQIGRGCRLEHDIYFHFDGIYQSGPSILIGDGCFLGSNCEFNITNRIEIGNHCQIASGSRFVDHNHGMEPGKLIGGQAQTSAPIVLGEDVWIGANAVILEGVTIGSGAVVGAGAVVTRPVAANTVVGGVPARVIRERSGGEPV